MINVIGILALSTLFDDVKESLGDVVVVDGLAVAAFLGGNEGVRDGRGHLKRD